VVTCNGDVGVVDYFDVGQRADDGVKELEQARWGGPQPPARLHDGLLRRNAVLADVSGSRAIVFLLQTKLQARDFHSLGGGADFGEIAQGMAEDRKAGGSDRVDWMSYQDGLREAVTSHRPVMLYFSTTWCPHCRNFERVLKDPRVVEQSRSFVMVKLDDQKDDELARKFSPDGRYFPRTLFLSPDGELDASLTNGSRRHRYTNSESDPDHLLRWMKRALAKLAP
jgi:thiol-disulfide isomerase/thioredoxin